MTTSNPDFARQSLLVRRRGILEPLRFLFAAVLLLGWVVLPQAVAAQTGPWVATWATASSTPSPFDPPTPQFADSTLRQIVHTSVGGSIVRVWFTNERGTEPLVIGSAGVALREMGASVNPARQKPLWFGGEPSITIPPGARVVSDPVFLRVPAFADVAISAHLPQDLSAQSSPVSFHARGLQTSYIAPGNQVAAPTLTGADTTTSYFYLAALDVRTNGEPRVVAAYGDSITDGDQVASMEPVDENARYTNFLARRLALTSPTAVINLGISGNQVASDFHWPEHASEVAQRSAGPQWR